MDFDDGTGCFVGSHEEMTTIAKVEGCVDSPWTGTTRSKAVDSSNPLTACVQSGKELMDSRVTASKWIRASGFAHSTLQSPCSASIFVSVAHTSYSRCVLSGPRVSYVRFLKLR